MKRLALLLTTALTLTACGTSTPQPNIPYPVLFTDWLVEADQGNKPAFIFNVTTRSPTPLTSVVITAECVNDTNDEETTFKSSPFTLTRNDRLDMVLLHHYGGPPYWAQFNVTCRLTATADQNTWLAPGE